MDLRQIRYFLEVCETLNVTRAAENCGVSQPALTKAVKALEEELGGPLFHRERNRTHLTELGRVMRDRFTAIDDEAKAAKEAARQVLGLENAMLRLGVMCTIGPARLMRFLAAFRADHPGIEIDLHETTPGELTGGLLDGDLDASLLGLPTPLHERFDCEALYRERMVVIFPPAHRFAAFDAVPIAEIAGEQYLDRLNCEFRSIWFDMLMQRGIEITVPYRSEREDWIQTMVQAGFGVSLVPEYSITVDGLAFRPVTEPEIDRKVELVTVAGRRHSPPLAAFLAACRAASWISG
ncbi:MAG: LysR family transcriptional regulator [Kiloniellales bacterium]|nr:LysR family transcriptional regulator [Kiloniellales bacterium]